MKNKKVIFRVDGGNSIGMGHITRALNLSRYLQEHFDIASDFVLYGDSYALKFIRRYHKDITFFQIPMTDQMPIIGLLLDRLKKEKEDKAILITDLFSMENKEEYSSSINAHGIFHVVFDDMLLSRIKGNIVINTSIITNKKEEEKDIHYYHGPAYSIINDLNIRFCCHTDNKKIIVSMGGSDPTDITRQVVDTIIRYNINGEFYIFIGPAFSDKLKVSLLNIRDKRMQFFLGVDRLDNVISTADFAVISGGITLYEMASCGIPSLIICQNRFQEIIANEFHKRGLGVYIGIGEYISDYDIAKALNLLLDDHEKRRHISNTALATIDKSGIKRVSNIIANLYKDL